MKSNDNKIQDGDSIKNKHTGQIDKCIAIFTDGMMCVEFESGMRSILHESHYKKHNNE